MNLTARIRST